MKEESSTLKSRLQDIVNQVELKNYEMSTDFLDMTQRSIGEKFLIGKKDIDFEFWGGFEDSERTICRIKPKFIGEFDDSHISVLKLIKPKKSRELKHRDYLGAILGLGVKREKVGDILVRDDGAYILVKRELIEFFLTNFTKVGSQNIEIKEIALDEVKVIKKKGKEIVDTVASLRLDNVVSSMVSISRKEAVAYIRQGLVFQNNIKIQKPEKEVFEGDKIVLRGYGRGFLREISGKSRKDRIYIKLEVFSKEE